MSELSDEKHKQYCKEYYLKNKEEWTKKKICEVCGGSYARNTKTQHFKSRLHIIAEKEKKINDLENKIDAIKEVDIIKEKKLSELEDKMNTLKQITELQNKIDTMRRKLEK